MAEEIKHLVRIANTDLPGHKAIKVAITKIKGIGYMYGNMVCNKAGIDANKKAGALNTSEIDRLNDVIENPAKYKVPAWMLNRRMDYTTGENMHLRTGDLDFTVEQDIRRLKKIRCYRGIRHSVGQPVRGQRTKSNFRRNKGKAVGVKKKAEARAAGGKE
jgi:small subunit ribosomal protein S13